jgi:hypothetical protein
VLAETSGGGWRPVAGKRTVGVVVEALVVDHAMTDFADLARRLRDRASIRSDGDAHLDGLAAEAIDRMDCELAEAREKAAALVAARLEMLGRLNDQVRLVARLDRELAEARAAEQRAAVLEVENERLRNIYTEPKVNTPERWQGKPEDKPT